jgi:hypothetical protein
MAGMGPPPKPAERRARRNADPVAQTVLPFKPAQAPDLPDVMPGGDDQDGGRPWPAATVRWWWMWQDAAQAELMTATDWSYLLDTAILHARLWLGDVGVAGELRLRVAKFGATPEDRARLRITFADADTADGGRGAEPVKAKTAPRYRNLRVVAKDAGAVAGA